MFQVIGDHLPTLAHRQPIQRGGAPFPTCMQGEERCHCNVSIRPGSHDADVYSYNFSAPPNPAEPLLVEVDCHWLDETTLQCCVIQVLSALWPPPGPPPPEPLSKK